MVKHTETKQQRELRRARENAAVQEMRGRTELQSVLRSVKVWVPMGATREQMVAAFKMRDPKAPRLHLHAAPSTAAPVRPKWASSTSSSTSSSSSAAPATAAPAAPTEPPMSASRAAALARTRLA